MLVRVTDNVSLKIEISIWENHLFNIPLERSLYITPNVCAEWSEVYPVLPQTHFFLYVMIYMNTNKLKNLQSPSTSC